ncbi:Hypothetical_protein [Hexamita inflata]|uniref:Hypothetical_protein n=1 Tax=Hexamita inflata TaxID=28002 RepID=A0AA86QQZ2_9EUKA|nr:Hypothetical protein HINF_LOCUS45234 [Hexamita inflata]
MFGLIGFVYGSLQLNSAQIYVNINNGLFNYFGIIGYAYGSSTQMINVNIQTQILNNQGYCVGTLAGSLKSGSIKLQLIDIVNSYVSGCHLIGLAVALLYSGTVSQVTSTSSQVYCLSLSNSSWRGAYVGIIGESFQKLEIQMFIVFNISIESYSNQNWAISGGIVGDTHSSPTIIQKSSVQMSQISAQGPVVTSISSGGLVGYIYDSSIIVSNVQVQNTNISGSSQTTIILCGGFFSAIRNQTTTIYNSTIYSIIIKTEGQNIVVGVLIGTDRSLIQPLITNNVYSSGQNVINEILIENCENIEYLTLSGC